MHGNINEFVLNLSTFFFSFTSGHEQCHSIPLQKKEMKVKLYN